MSQLPHHHCHVNCLWALRIVAMGHLAVLVVLSHLCDGLGP
jgi:hypothetical protein